MRAFLTYILLTLTAFLCLTATGACNSAGCTEARSAVPLAQFLSRSTGNPLTLDSVCIRGIDAPNDSAMLSFGTKAGEVYLPFRSAQSHTAWCISYGRQYLNDVAMNDTVIFSYTSRPWFASEECGAMYTYRITDVQYTTHVLDSVAYNSQEITNVDVPSIRLYFGPNVP